MCFVETKLTKEYVDCDKNALKRDANRLNAFKSGMPLNDFIARYNQDSSFDTNNICDKKTILKHTYTDMTNKFANQHVYTNKAKKANKRVYRLAQKLDNKKYYLVNYNIELDFLHPKFVSVNKHMIIKRLDYMLKIDKQNLKNDKEDLRNAIKTNNKIKNMSKKQLKNYKKQIRTENDLPF